MLRIFSDHLLQRSGAYPVIMERGGGLARTVPVAEMWFGVWGYICSPRNFLDFRLSEMVSDAFFSAKAPSTCNTMMTGGQSFRGEKTRRTAW